MRIHLIATFLLCLGVASCSSGYDEGHSTLSPNKKWFVDLETKSGANGFTRIRIYDTDVYPDLKTKPNPRGTPTALFTVPIQFYARAVDFKWNPASTVLRMEQPELNGKPPIYYSLDLDSFSFSKVEK
jgi:hypothetical protein